MEHCLLACQLKKDSQRIKFIAVKHSCKKGDSQPFFYFRVASACPVVDPSLLVYAQAERNW